MKKFIKKLFGKSPKKYFIIKISYDSIFVFEDEKECSYWFLKISKKFKEFDITTSIDIYSSGDIELYYNNIRKYSWIEHEYDELDDILSEF